MVEGSLLDPPNLNDSPSIEHREGSDSCRALPSRWHPAPTRRWTECLQFADLEKRVTDIDRFSSPRPHSTSGPDLTSTPGLCVCLPFPQATNAPTLPAPTLPAPAGFSVSCSAAPPPPRPTSPGGGHGADFPVLVTGQGLCQHGPSAESSCLSPAGHPGRTSPPPVTSSSAFAKCQLAKKV